MKTLIKTAIIALALSLLIGLFVINRAQARYISSLEESIASRGSLIERMLDDMEHSMYGKEYLPDVQQINVRTVYLDFGNTESVDTFIELLEHLKLKLIEENK